jgi:aminopeptidase-like protein
MDLKFAHLQYYLQRFFDGKHSVFDICERFKVPFQELFEYVHKFQEKGLIQLGDVNPSISNE